MGSKLPKPLGGLGNPSAAAAGLAAAMHAGFGHLPGLSAAAAAGLPSSMGLHPTPLSALTAAARSPSMPPGLQGPPGGVLGGGPLRRRISDKAGGPLPISNGE